MTIETRSTIALGDIVAIEYECLNCHAKSIRPLDEKHRVAAGCGNCNTHWIAHGSQEHEDLTLLANVLRNFGKSNVNNHVLVRLEVKGIQKAEV